MTSSTNNDNDNNPSELSTPPPTNPNDDNALRTSTGSSGIQSSSVGGSGLGSALNSPLLNGEHIVLLSLSNDNTPRNNGAVERRRSGFDVIERQDNTNLLSSSTEVSISTGASSDSINNIGNIIITDELLSNNNNNNAHGEAYSPPPDSIIQSDLQSLTPPPLSLKSDGNHQYNLHHHDHHDGGAVSLFSGNGGGGGGGGASGSGGLFDYVAAQQTAAPQSQQQQQPPSTSSNKQQKRPPLPPRWAIGTTGNDHNNPYHHHPQILPPKQVGPLSHRRVLSTGDASVMSVLTDPDSGLDTSPPDLPTGTATGGGAAATVNDKNSFLPIPAINNRKRGVSWDIKDHYGGGQQQQSGGGGGTSQFSTEEQAAFNTLGILQPLLMDDMDNDGIIVGDGGDVGNDSAGGIGGFGLEDLMQPVLLDDHHDDVDENPQAARQQQQQQLHQSPPLPPENILPLKSPATTATTPVSKSLAQNKPSTSRRAMYARSKRSQNMTSISQFEDEANLAIMAALSMYNLEQSEILGDGAVQQHEQKVKQEEEEEEVEEGDEDEANDLVGGIPHHVVRPTPTHRWDLSAITLSDGLDRSPTRPAVTTTADAGIHTFEDVAWHEGYDSQGRIDGTLVEERESKYIEEELGIDLNAGSKFGAAMMNNDGLEETASVASSRKQTGQQPASVSGSDQASVQSKGTDLSKGSKGSKASKERPVSPTKTGLRHRRTGTRGTGVLSAAQELAAMATIDESDETESNKGHFKIESDGHGIGNLLDGATLLFEQKKKLEGGADDADDEGMPFIAEETSIDMEHESDSPHDEETGDANANAKKQHKRTPTHLFGRREKPTKKDRQMERQFRMKLWYDDLIAPRLPIFITAATHSVMFVMMPLLFVAIILYYACGNPLTGGKGEVAALIESGDFQGSWSWWILFILRQFIILSCVKAGEVISIDIIALRTPIFVKVFGSFATLMFVQARGWPYVITFWGVFDILTLYGTNAFAKHWLFWQDLVGMCNEQNPAAAFLHGSFYLRVLLSMIFVGVVTSLKRLMLATFLGRRSFAHYGPEFETILAKMILVSQVAHLAKRIEANVLSPSTVLASGYAYTMTTKANFAGLASDSDDFESGSPTHRRNSVGNNSQTSDSSPTSPQGFGDSLRRSVYGKKLISSLSRKNMGMLDGMTRGNSSSKVEMMKLLEEWEEPDLQANAASKVSIKDILQFRQAMSLVSDTYPFTQSFGPASTRAICVESAEKIFTSLLSKNANTEQKLPFETLAELAAGKDGELLHDKVKALVRLFRPDRKGFLTKLDFVTSIDNVYRELRLYRANLSNSQQIDESFHGLINILHYFVVILVMLIIMGFNNWESLLSMTTFFFSFSFMFGPASSKYFEGILLIFVRRPYDIGDKVAISDPETDTSASGSSTWFVEKVTLYSTTVRFATTNEVATYSNGSLARLRIINAKRSPKAIVYVYNKFGSDVPFRLIQVFKASVENFVKSRPREWAQLNGFRATRVNLEANFIEYVIVLTHRELWQNVGPILQSKADLASFSLEVSKKLNLRYEQPPKPIHLSLDGRHYDQRSVGRDDGSASSGLQQVREMFKKEE
eukprot:CAMPEP_0113387966 /NCGR_PEP_ID=MMETSP0013_2-20120614/8829_1 /TAXON_ID=2843 ORGANISM="Skeletonema costatum, Strain 1716" /NCGR_SAMPLE_ID=MMETSP0013_2 /ASSEMBLY_ACC=CAM_ASM_000158 /LENGTH=1582 /DNA_ID=CAMNT_0000270919 /DNA_START=159 /DNA_END=4907 /DNA_ORIENTATION=- /assembly_acc=CAM_ASM_000158